MTETYKLGKMVYMGNTDPPISIGPSTLTVRIKWIVVAGIIVLVGGGGWGAALLQAAGGAFQFPEGAEPQEVKTLKDTNTQEHVEIKKRLDVHEKAVTEIKDSVQQIRMDIIQDRASREAHRVTDPIRDAVTRSSEYDRILRINEWRLRQNMEPCFTRTCGG